ncbi:MAG: CPBP family intramembrane glutamic endopeptidase [Thermoanaerobaculia bacterium]|nr:CPBP family intramembrane glutamic endopeptidase [Thermoanaerobaculia bacterium]
MSTTSRANRPEEMRDTRRFLLVVFLLGVAAQGAAVWQGLDDRGGWLLRLTMWAPAAAAFLTSGRTRRMAWAALRRAGWRWWPAALGVGFSYVILERGIAWAAGGVAWNEENFPLAPAGGGIEGIEGVATVLGFGPQSFTFLALNLLVTMSVAALVFALVGGVGEELGWRAVLQPLLERRFGLLGGTLWVGVAWAYWHLPANLAGHNDSTHPLLTALVIFPIFVVSVSFALAWLYRACNGAIWPVAIAHAANNIISSAFVVRPVGWGVEMLSATAAALLLGAFFAWRLAWKGAAADGRGEPTPSIAAS